MGSLKIDVFNDSFTISASEDDAYLQELLAYYKRVISQIQNVGSLTEPLQISSLAGIILCDELFKEKTKKQNLPAADESDRTADKKADELTKQMIERINGVLSNV